MGILEDRCFSAKGLSSAASAFGCSELGDVGTKRQSSEREPCSTQVNLRTAERVATDKYDTGAAAGHQKCAPLKHNARLPRDMAEITLHSTITCPECGHTKSEAMPEEACQWFYECSGCGAVLRPKSGDCCVFCSYGSVKCPPIQASRASCCGE